VASFFTYYIPTFMGFHPRSSGPSLSVSLSLRAPSYLSATHHRVPSYLGRCNSYSLPPSLLFITIHQALIAIQATQQVDTQPHSHPPTHTLLLSCGAVDRLRSPIVSTDTLVPCLAFYSFGTAPLFHFHVPNTTTWVVVVVVRRRAL
jgi:hypothetical protein